MKESDEFKEMMVYNEEITQTKNHPKLKKLSEILSNFFED